MRKQALLLENPALRQQLAAYRRTSERTRLRPSDREHYNRARPSQAIGAIPDPYPELQVSPSVEKKLVALPLLGGLEHDDRMEA